MSCIYSLEKQYTLTWMVNTTYFDTPSGDQKTRYQNHKLFYGHCDCEAREFYLNAVKRKESKVVTTRYVETLSDWKLTEGGQTVWKESN